MKPAHKNRGKLLLPARIFLRKIGLAVRLNNFRSRRIRISINDPYSAGTIQLVEIGSVPVLITARGSDWELHSNAHRWVHITSGSVRKMNQCTKKGSCAASMCGNVREVLGHWYMFYPPLSNAFQCLSVKIDQSFLIT